MLSLGLSCALKPALPRSALQAAVRSRVQPFSTRFGTFKNVVQKPPPYSRSRTMITDTQTVTQASAQDVWKKFAITAVRANTMYLHLMIQVCRPPWQALSSLQKVS